MLKVNSEAKAKQYLKLFDNNLDKAIAGLRSAASKRSKGKVKVPANAPVVVEATDLTKSYKLGSENIAALDKVNIKIQQGEFIAITGESGSGKSTLLQLIGALDKPSEGTLLVDGQEIKGLSDSKLSVFRNRTIGFVFQFFYLQPFLTTEVNLEVPGMFAKTPKAERKERASELASAVGLSDRLQHLPKELSGGQMQRAAIARALLNKPKILLADEPTGNLDSANSQSIIELFEKVRNQFGTTVIIVTHDHNIAARADREITLKDGKVTS